MSSLKRLVQMARSDLLVTPRYEEWLLKTNGNPVYSSETVAKLVAQLQAKQRDRTAFFSASAQGTCPRAQVFGVIGVPGARITDSNQVNIFLDGQWRHLRHQAGMLEAGIITDIERLTEFGGIIKGTLDGLNEIEWFGIEIKGIRTLAWIIKDGPKQQHLRQIAAYFLAQPKLSKFALIYDDKATQEYMEFVVERDDPNMALTIDLVERDILSLGHYRDSKELPPILKECARGTGQTFRQCAFRFTCLGCSDYQEAEASAEGAQPIRLSRIKRRRS